MDENKYKEVEYIFLNFLNPPTEFKILFPKRYLNREYFGIKEIIKYKDSYKTTVNFYRLSINVIYNLINFLKLNVAYCEFDKLKVQIIQSGSSTNFLNSDDLFLLNFHIPTSVNKKNRLITTFEFLTTTKTSTVSTIHLLFVNGKKI